MEILFAEIYKQNRIKDYRLPFSSRNKQMEQVNALRAATLE